MLSAEFLPASSRRSKGDCGFYQGGLERNNPMTSLKAMETDSDPSRIYERSYSITGFVGVLDAILDVDEDNRWSGKTKFIIKNLF